MRQIVLDTETTGLEHQDGHRIIEIGAIEIIDRKVSERAFHHYINPEREIDFGAMEVHGITNEFVADKPVFAKIADSLLTFIQGAELIIHNAAFDVGFLDAEFSRLKLPSVAKTAGRVTDSLAMARGRYPGKRNSLDALCERLGVDNTSRSFHGAALDAKLLGEVYLAMTRGQDALAIGSESGAATIMHYERPTQFIVRRATSDELIAHEKMRAVIDKASGGKTVWNKPSA
jgi:DNA polymerase III subunit epsilon